MNQTANDEAQVPTPVEGPGGHLKAVREAEGLELARVAVLLHLGEEKLEALEADFQRYFPDILAHARDWVAAETASRETPRS